MIRQRVWRRLLGCLTGALCGLMLLGGGQANAAAPPPELKPGSRLCLIGNTLAERMQHDGHLEALLHLTFPQHKLVIRNLGYSGDELTLRLRSAGFGTPDEHLTLNKADVVWAFFGYNESYAGAAGVEKFQADLAEFITHTRSHKYNGAAPPQLVLFTPIAFQHTGDRNLPDGAEHNARLEMYAAAMLKTAAAHDCPCVDLFEITRGWKFLNAPAEPLTINGVHLTPAGNRQLATGMLARMFPQAWAQAATPTLRDPAAADRVARLYRAVLDKNLHWYNRYRTVDGYSIFGGRADLKFVNDQTNREVMQREMEILDAMTANRDERVWALAAGRDHTVNDDNTPPFIPVITNKPGAGPDGQHVYLGGEQAIGQMTVAQNMKVNLVASEEQFPELINPVQMSFDPRGRLWVAVWPTYPHWQPKGPMNDKLLILEDDDGDGRADRCQTFVDDLHNPTGFEFWNGGVLVAMAPELLFLKDTDGDDRADVRVRLLSGLDTADTHHAANSFTFDPCGALYMQEGTFHHTQVETAYTPSVRCANAGVFRYEPRAQKFEVYVTHGFANPHGHAFDRWGQDFVYDGTGAQPYHGALFSGYLPYPQKHATPPQVYKQRTRPCPGVEVLSSRHFPPENQGNLLVGNVIGVQGLLQYKLRDEGASFAADEVEPIFVSSDVNFRPSDFEIGPDGAIWFTDWQNPVIGHMQHNLRDPSRDKTHGRVYRVSYPGRPLLTPPRIAGAGIDELLDLLKEPEDRLRYRVRIELSARSSDEVIRAAVAWVKRLDTSAAEYEHHLLEALWVHAQHNVVNRELLDCLLGAKDFRARAAAARVLCYWRDRVSDALDIYKRLAADEHPRVRLEAVRAASFFATAAALEVPLTAAKLPSDAYLDFVRGETLKALEPFWKRALAEGGELPNLDDASARTLLAGVSTAELLKAQRTRVICRELLGRRGVTDDVRGDALARLGRLENKSQAALALAALVDQDGRGAGDESILYDLGRLLLARDAQELQAELPALEKLAVAAERPISRQLGYAALVTARGGADAVWPLAVKSVGGLCDLVRATPLLADVGLRNGLAPQLERLLDELPSELAAAPETASGIRGRTVRIELPGTRTLTLAEVEVISDGANVAPQGRATQKNTAHFGGPARAIDGNTSGAWADSSQMHSQENTQDPWWQVDLGQEVPIDAIAVYNRTDGDLGARLDGFTLIVLDGAGKTVYRSENLPAPRPKSTFALGDGPPRQRVRRAALSALAAIPGREAQAYAAAARFIRDGDDLPAAMHALLGVGVQHWPKDQALPLLDRVLGYLGGLPVADRTSPAALDAMQLGESLASLLPGEEARPARRALRALGVQVIRLATVPDRMLFDKDVLAVEAGKPLEIVFENTDIMPHNWVLTKPGSLVEVGTQAEALATDPGALGRHYVPQSEKILASSRLLAPRQTQRLQITAPERPGVYPYVCTYPGHWRRMYGALFVVASLDDYLSAPESYLASQNLAPADDMLRSNRPRTEWKLADLEAFLPQAQTGRSYNVGRQVFQAANCVACHRVGGAGQELGPDLSKLDAKIGPAEILKSMLEPSAKIDDKYRSVAFELASGKTVIGLVVRETPDAVEVVENPLARAEATRIAKSEIENRQASPVSLMPLGMVDRLSREEILDLLAYLVARGNPQHEVYEDGAHHGHGGH